MEIFKIFALCYVKTFDLLLEEEFRARLVEMEKELTLVCEENMKLKTASK